MNINGNCPHCKEKVLVDFDKMEIGKKPNNEITNVSEAQQQTQVIEKPEPEIKEVIKVVAPSDEPFYECKNGNCGDGMHKNPNYSRKPNKKCKNCDSLNGNKKCKKCGNKDPEEFEDLEDDELNDLGIPSPTEHEHNHDEE